MIKLGSIVSGVVERVTPHVIVVHVRALGNIKGTINPEHLADHQGKFFLCHQGEWLAMAAFFSVF